MSMVNVVEKEDIHEQELVIKIVNIILILL